MEANKKSFDGHNEGVKVYRKEKELKLSRLKDYKVNYTSDNFIDDLVKYFDQEVDFNLDKIRNEIKKPQRLNYFIAMAKEKNTHPIIEFLEDLFKDLTA